MMNSLKELFESELKKLYSAEVQLMKALPKMEAVAVNPKLAKAFAEHGRETINHKERLEEIAEEMEIELKGNECQAMAALIEESNKFLEKNISEEVQNAGLIAGAQRIEHYEIAGYGTVSTYAENLGLKNTSEKLKQTLKEEYEVDEKLNSLAKNNINGTANQ